MTRKKKTSAPSRGPSEIEQARNDLFGHIHRCGVLRADEEQQLEWMKDTIEYLAECYPSLTEGELEDLKNIGLRFCRPVIANAPVEAEATADADAEVDAEVDADAETETAAA